MSKKAPVPIDSNKTSKIQRRLCLALGVVSGLGNQGYHKLDSVLVISDSVNKKKATGLCMPNWIL
jgi:hypothetical protein